MPQLDRLDILFLVWAFVFQIALIVHFSLRKWLFDRYVLKFGWIVYGLALPATLVSVIMLQGGRSWPFWLGGVILLVWSALGSVVEYVRKIEWRSPIRWSIFVPYVTLYLAGVMFYWWPVGMIYRPMWYVYAVLFVAAMFLNVTSHRPGRGEER
jgi:hypothetical protein